MPNSEYHPPFTAEGLLVATGWDSAGRACALSLHAPGERQYRIEPFRGAGLALLGELGKRVRLAGEIGPGNAVVVWEYLVIEDFGRDFDSPIHGPVRRR